MIYVLSRENNIGKLLIKISPNVCQCVSDTKLIHYLKFRKSKANPVEYDIHDNQYNYRLMHDLYFLREVIRLFRVLLQLHLIMKYPILVLLQVLSLF
jgi:hypothetical protein